MQQGRIVGLHVARVKNTASVPVPEAMALSAKGLEGDRSCNENNPRQVLVMDKETLDKLGLEMGQIKENITTTGLDLSQVEEGQVMFIGEMVTIEIVWACLPCHKMDAIRSGLQQLLKGRRGKLAMVINGGPIKVGDPIRIEP